MIYSLEWYNIGILSSPNPSLEMNPEINVLCYTGEKKKQNNYKPAS